MIIKVEIVVPKGTVVDDFTSASLSGELYNTVAFQTTDRHTATLAGMAFQRFGDALCEAARQDVKS